MITDLYAVLLGLSLLIAVYMAQKNYENIDIHYWTVVVLIPVIILGYWLKSRVTTVEGAMLMFCFIYLDSTILLAVFLFSILRFMNIVAKPWVKIGVYFLSIAHLVMVWSSIHNDRYYRSLKLYDTGMGIATITQPGPLKTMHWLYMAVIFLAIISLIVIAVIKSGSYSKRFFFLSAGVVVAAIIIYLFETAFKVSFTTLPILYVAADLYIALSYDKAHAHDISHLISERQNIGGIKGYAAVDNEKNFLGCNKKIYDFLPSLKDQKVDKEIDGDIAKLFFPLIDSLEKGERVSKLFNVGDIVCKCDVSRFSVRKGGKNMGYIFDVSDVTKEQKAIKLMQEYSDTLNEEVNKKTENIKNIQQRVVLGLANMVENRDSNTGGHVKRTSDVIKYIVDEAKKQGIYYIDDRMCDDIVRAAPMHDLGKITIENAILLKPGKLTDEEYAIMKTHSVKSSEFVTIILKDVEEQHFVDVAYNIARYHHEKWNGRGYPDGLVGEMIPLEARLMAIADVYDALVSKRCYKEPMSFEQAAEIMIESMGSHFDPNLLSVFTACREKLENYYMQNGERL